MNLLIIIGFVSATLWAANKDDIIESVHLLTGVLLLLILYFMVS